VSYLKICCQSHGHLDFHLCCFMGISSFTFRPVDPFWDNFCEMYTTSTFIFFYLVVLRFEIRASLLVGKHSTIWATCPTHFAPVYFSDMASYFCLGLVLDCNYPTSIFQISGIIGKCHHAQLIFWNSISLIFLPRLSSNHDSPNLWLLSSWNYKHVCLTPMFFLHIDVQSF
jgi:hypothetical protein